MGKASNRSATYVLTGNYYGDDDSNTIDAIGLGGHIYAKGGNDHITVGSISAKVYTGSGNDSVVGGAAYLCIDDTTGNLKVKGADGYIEIEKNGDGNVDFTGIAGGTVIDHTGDQGDIRLTNAALYNRILRKGAHGNIIFEGIGGYNGLWHETNQGNLSFTGGGGGNKLVRTWHDTYHGSRGDVIFKGAGAANIISSKVQTGNITFEGVGAYNQIIRKGEHDGIDTEGLAYANADDIFLTKAILKDKEGNSHSVILDKTMYDPNTYMVAYISSVPHTPLSINKIRLFNEPTTNRLMYSIEGWSNKNNNHGFVINESINNMVLSAVEFEYQKKSVNENKEEIAYLKCDWQEYGNGATINAADIELLNGTINSYFNTDLKDDILVSSIYSKAVKSTIQENTYLFSMPSSSGGQIIAVQLINDPITKHLKYRSTAKYIDIDISKLNLAYEDVSENNGYIPRDNKSIRLKDIYYRTILTRHTTKGTLGVNQSEGPLITADELSGTYESSGDINFVGAGAGNVIKSDVTKGNISFVGDGIANVIEHSSQIGNTSFNGAGAANVIVKSGKEGDLTFNGGGIANVLVHQSEQGQMNVNAGGAVNVLVRIGDGQYHASLLALGNISVHQGDGTSRVIMVGGLNTHTQIGSGNGLWLAGGGFNVITQVGKGEITSVLIGGANVLSKIGHGNLISGMMGGGNIITHITDDEEQSDTTAIVLGGANIFTKKGKGNALVLMGGLANVITHVGDGSTTGVMVGAGNVLTKVGKGNTVGVMLGLGNVLTHVGDGLTLGVMGAVGNIFTKVGNGTSIAVMGAAGNLFTSVGNGDAWALMGAKGNIFTKVGHGNVLVLMIAEGNVFTQVGDGITVALMLAEGNISTKVGNGLTLSAMVGEANIFTHIGDGETFAAMIGEANILTKVGKGLTLTLMIGEANIYTHVGSGTSIGLFAGEANIMTKVGDGTTLAAMFGEANIMTHVGNGLTGVLALGKANIATKVGDDFMGVLAIAEANVITHVGNSTTAAVLLGKGNILTKVGDGVTVGLLISDIGNIMTHVGDGMTIGITKGKANIITKVGKGMGVNAAWGEANIFTQIGDGDRYNFANGKANIFTKVGSGHEISVVHGDANIMTHVGDGDDYTGAWGKANVVTKVGNGRNIVLAKGDANIITQVGRGDSFNGLWSKANIVTKVGDGMQVTTAKGDANITTTVGNGLNVTAVYGDLNINTKVGNGTSINVVWGKYNVNTQVGDGLNIAVMKGKANANIQVGNGIMINASYARNNVVIKVGNGDFYSLAIASSNTQSNKLAALFAKSKQTVLGVMGSKAINYLVQGNDASSSGARQGHGVIAIPTITKLDGFNMKQIEGVGSNLKNELSGRITNIETPDLGNIEDALNINGSSHADRIKEHTSQNAAAQNALSDKDCADVNAHRLKQEKNQQLTAISGTQTELESTDQETLKRNGQEHRKAMQAEADIETAELTKLAQGFNTLSDPTEYNNDSELAPYRYFADGILNKTQTELTGAKDISSNQLITTQKTFKHHQKNVKEALTKSESAVVKGEQHQAGTEKDIHKAQADVDTRKMNAHSQHVAAQQLQTDAHRSVQAAQSRGERDAFAAKKKADQAQQDAKSVKQSEHDLPNRQAATGSSLSGNAYVVQAASETNSHINVGSRVEADGRFSQGLTNQELDGLNNAAQIINQLQVRAGIRIADTNNWKASLHSKNSARDKIKVNSYLPAELNQRTSYISGLNLEGLGEIPRQISEENPNWPIRRAPTVFDMVAGGTESAETSFDFSQNRDFLTPLKGVLETEGYGGILVGLNDELTRKLKNGACFALSARYMIEERKHGPGGGKRYIAWLKDVAQAVKYQGSPENSTTDLGSAKQKYLNHYRRGFVHDLVKDLLPTQQSQIKALPILKAINELNKELQENELELVEARADIEKTQKYREDTQLLVELNERALEEAKNELDIADPQTRERAQKKVDLNQHAFDVARSQMLEAVNQETLAEQKKARLQREIRTAQQDIKEGQERLVEVNQLYGGKLHNNGLDGPNINNAFDPHSVGYEFLLNTLQDIDSSTYISFMSNRHAMAAVIHVAENGEKTWSFYDPNYGCKSFTQYEDFKTFMNKFLKTDLLKGYDFEKSNKPGQSFNVEINRFYDSEIIHDDNTWQAAKNREQRHVLRSLREQGDNFTFGNDLIGKVIDFKDDAITLDVTTQDGRTISVEVTSDNIDHAANLIKTNIEHILVNTATNKFSLQVAEDGDSIRIRGLNPDSSEQSANVVPVERLNSDDTVVRRYHVNEWEHVVVTPQTEILEGRFHGQIIIQTENAPVVAKAAANLAGKHPNNSIIVQLDAEGQYRVVYGDPSTLSGNLRWQIVGHGRDGSENNNLRLSGYSATDLSANLAKFQHDFAQEKNINIKPKHISLVGCSLVSDDKQTGFAQQFITAMDEKGIRSNVSARSSDVAVDVTGRKFTFDEHGNWVHHKKDNKVVLSWNEQGEITTHAGTLRSGIAEGDINLSRIGITSNDDQVHGAIASHDEVFIPPKKRQITQQTSAANEENQQLSYSGNIQVDVGDGEFTSVNWGTSNVGVKVGTGGFKSLVFGDNNAMVHIGNGDSKHSVNIAGYQAFEGAQLFVGNRNISFNMGRSNDLLVMMEKSIITPPLINPFDGASRISGSLQNIAHFGEEQDWLAAQNQQWTLASAKKFAKDLSGLDQTSSVDYNTLVDLDSQNERSGRGLKNDIEVTLNKKYNQWLGGNGSPEIGQPTRTEKLRDLNQDAVFNFAVGGQGADIIVTTSNWNFVFGDNIQSLLDTDLGSLFGLMTQQYSKSGLLVTTFTYTPTDLPRQLQNRLLGRMAGVGANTTLGDIFGVDYTADGHIVSRNGEPVDGEALLKEMVEVIGQFGDEQLKAFTDPAKFLDKLKAGMDMGAEGVKSFAESHGLKQREPEESTDNTTPQTEETSVAPSENPAEERPFGFNALNLPNIFATIFNKDKQTEMSSMVENIKENLTADLMNMQEKTFDFLRNSGHLQGDGDLHVSLGNYNFNWGGDGKDLGAYLGDNNNFWGGRGDDVYYAMGVSNVFSGGEGNDTGVLMGRENWMFGGEGNDIAVVAGRVNHVYLDSGDDQSFVFGEGGEINTGTGCDYAVISGNFNRIDTGEGQDYSVTIGNNNQVEMNGGDDFANIFGNENTIRGGVGNDTIKLMGFHSTLKGEDGNDHLIAESVAKFSLLDGGEGNDLLVLGGYQNTFKGGSGVDSFVVSSNIIDNIVEDISSEDNIVFNNLSWSNLWLERSGFDLKIDVLRNIAANTDQDKFENIGSVTFSDYFNGKRAKIVINMNEKDETSEREYTALSDKAVDTLVLAMSSVEPEIGSNGFIDKLDNNTRYAVTTAWSDVIYGKGLVA